MFTIINRTDEFIPLNEIDLNKIDNFDIIVDSTNSSVLFLINTGYNKTPVILNKQHVDYKNRDNRRFPDRFIMKHVSPQNVHTPLEQIEFILEYVLDDNTKKDLDRRMNIKYDNILSNSDTYSEDNDTPLKFSVYRDFIYEDEDTKETRYYRLESTLACWATIVNFKSIPLCKIKYHKEITKDNKVKFVGEVNYKRIVDIITNKLSSPRESNLLVKECVERVQKYMIDNTPWSTYNKYVLFINGYATWVKEINEDGSYKIKDNILNSGPTEFRKESKLDPDIYTYIGNEDNKLDPQNIICKEYLKRIKIIKQELQPMFDYERIVRNKRSLILL